MGTPPHGGKRGKVPAGPKAQPGKKSGKASVTRQAAPKGTSAKGASYGITDTTRNHTSAVTGGTSRNTPNGMGALTSKAKRQVC